MRKGISCLLCGFLLAVGVVPMRAEAKMPMANAPARFASGHAQRAAAEDMDAYLRSEWTKTRIPGMGVQIVDADEVLYSQTFGDCTDADAGFIIGSLSKSFTAIAILQLEERGALDRTDPIARHLPQVDPASATTIQQLLNQTSGIDTYDTVERFDMADAPTAYAYANANYSLLGRIVEAASGMPYAQYVQRHILDPLGMDHTFFSLDAAKASGMAPGHRNAFGAMVRGELPYPEGGDIAGWLTMPSGYIISSTRDMGRYLRMLLGGGAGVLSADRVADMMTVGVDVADGYGYGMGLALDMRSGERLVIHGGNVENYTTYMILMPERGIAAIVLCNAGDFFVANEMVIQLANNAVNRYIGKRTDDIAQGAYASAHALIDAACAAALLLCALPLAMLGRWRRKRRMGATRWDVIALIALHVVAPALLLAIFPLMGEPLYVVRRFVPDVFGVVVVGSALLALGGIAKMGIWARTRHRCAARGGPWCASHHDAG